jgi:succinate dehydrogenase flavin-adding protein (antitoxin of CptAB toxin-antitoxin module)
MASSKQETDVARNEEKLRLLNQIERGLVEVDKEMKLFREAYEKFLQSGEDFDRRLSSWSKFFNDVSLVSQERTVEAGTDSKKAKAS